MNSDKFSLFCCALAQHQVDHVLILQHGKVIGRHDFCPESRQNQYSVSKSITGTAAAFAMEEGLFSMDSHITELLTDALPPTVGPELAALTIRHLLTMTVGQKKPQLMGDSRKFITEHDWVSYLLAQPFAEMPGRSFQYSNFGPYLLGRIIERQSGQDLIDYLMPRLFEPLQISRPEGERDPEGHIFGAGGIQLSTAEIARFGQLYLQNGCWQGYQLLPAAWVSRVERTAIPTGQGDGEYSLLFWRSRHDSYSAVGKFGQYCTICREKDAVIAINAHDKGDPNLLEYVWTYLYPWL